MCERDFLLGCPGAFTGGGVTVPDPSSIPAPRGASLPASFGVPGGPHSEPGSELHPQKGDPFLYASGFDPSPEMLVLPKLSEVPCWNPSAQPARGPREEGGGLHCLLFPPQTGPSLRLGSGLDAVEISLGKSHKPIRNLTSFAFSD